MKKKPNKNAAPRRVVPTWMDSYQKLVEFQKEHGHCWVPKKGEHTVLYRWVAKQRGYERHKLTPEKTQLLKDIGFEWEGGRGNNNKNNQLSSQKHEAMWNEKFQALKRYLQEGRSTVLARMTEYDKALGEWASNQRKRHQKNYLRADRVAKLEGIGFSLEVVVHKPKPPTASKKRDDQWDMYFDRLVAYKKEYGDCRVPFSYAPDPSLAMWVSAQRRLHRKGQWHGGEIRKDRLFRLNQVGFVWDVNKRKLKNGDYYQPPKRRSSDANNSNSDDAAPARKKRSSTTSTAMI